MPSSIYQQRHHIIDVSIGNFLKICSMTNEFVRGGMKGVGYAKYLSWLWACLGVQGFNIKGKKLFGFCGSKTRFFIFRVGGGGS